MGLSDSTQAPPWVLGFLDLTDHSAPLFTFISGVSFWIHWHRQSSLGVPVKQISSLARRRSLFLFILGFLILSLTQKPRDILSWDILTLIGASLFILSYLTRAKTAFIFTLVIMLILVSPFLRELCHYESFWVDNEYHPRLDFKEAVFGFFVNGEFPIFPWLAFPLVGWLCGGMLQQNKKAVLSMGILGLSMFFLGLVLEMAEPSSFYPATTPFLIKELGLVTGLLSLCHFFLDRKFKTSYSSIALYSRYSLTIFFLHSVAYIWPLALFGLLQKSDTEAFYGNAVSSVEALGLSALFLGVCFPILKFWEQHNNRWSLEWWDAQFCKRPLEVMASGAKPSRR